MTSKKVQGESAFTFVCDPGAIQIEALAEGEGTADGKPRLPRFSMVAYTGGPMRIAGWRYPVIVDLAGLAIPSQSRPIRFGHDMASGVGHTDAIKIEDGKLVATGLVSRDTGAAREIVVSARNGFPWQASIGSTVEEFEFVKENQKVIVNGRELAGPLNVVRKATLGEISFVDLGADGATSASVAAVASGLTKENSAMDNPLKTAPETQATEPTEVQAGAAPAVSPPPAADDASRAVASHADAAAEAARVLAIRQICAGRHPDIEAQAVRDKWDANRCALEILRASRPKAPAVHFRDDAVNGTVLEAACMLTAKAAAVETMFDEPTLDAAQRRF
ncbi:MAG: hypothetical protein KJZ87_27055, partial [Thermoguttaceae bacterium]|nr:hypothetical protein [Thermoguttaceae bacterium]